MRGAKVELIEHRVITDKKTSIVDLDLICKNLKEYSLFQNAILTKYGIHVPSEDVKWELVGIGLSDEGFFVVDLLNRKDREILFDIIQKTMSDKGIKTVIEDA